MKNERKERYFFKHKERLRTAILFSSLALSFNLLIWFFSAHGYLFSFEVAYAQVVGKIVSLLGFKAKVVDNLVLLEGASWLINTECTALFVMAIFSSFILAYPAQLKEKVLALLVGLSVIFLANMLRFILLAWFSSVKPAYASYFHDYLWQVAFILMVVMLWLIWLEVLSHAHKAFLSH
jgi:exosortase/archaeosortase family protein